MNLNTAEIRSKILQAMAHPVRLITIDLLKEKEKSFSEIFKTFDFDKSTISKHLTVLKNAGIIKSRKEGTETFFTLAVPCIINFFNCIDAVIENNINEQKCCLS
jgi:ArsR family transcriptional regulator